MIRAAHLDDSSSITEIYNHYISHSIATFEEQEIAIADMSLRIQSTLDDKLPWLVAEQEGLVVGYAYANKWKQRSAYQYSVEATIYLSQYQQSKGLGSILYRALIDQLKSKNIHSIMGGIALPNDASIALHEKLGFNKVAHFREVGKKFNQWINGSM